DSYNFNSCSASGSDYGVPFQGAAMGADNEHVFSQQLAVMSCPSAPEPELTSSATANAYQRRNARRGTYLFATGWYEDRSHPYGRYSGSTVALSRPGDPSSTFNANVQGVFGNNGAAKIADIKDGTSNTVMIGEAVGSGIYKTSSSYGPYWGSGVHTCCHGRVVAGRDQLGAAESWATRATQYHINHPRNN